MAFVQIDLTDPTQRIEEITEDLIAVSRDTGGILVLKGEKTIVRVSLNRKEAAIIAAQLAPHIP